MRAQLGGRAPRALIASALATVALAGGLASASPAGAARPCWKALLADWDDGRIDGVYPPACYRLAIAHLPADAVLYSNAKAEIRAALRDRALSSAPGKTQTAGRTRAAIGRTAASGSEARPLAVLGVAAAALLLLAFAAWEVAARRRARPLPRRR